MTFLVSLVRHTAVLLAAAASGALIAAPWVPGGGRARLFSPERAAWGVAVGLALLSGSVPLALLVGVRPGWIPFLVLAAAAAAASRLRPAAGSRVAEPVPVPVSGPRSSATALRWVIALGIALFALRALTEPMWSNDFLAIWGLKGKIIYSLSAVPDRLHADPALAFAHPEYPLGIPFLYAGLASLAGGWDDHAAAVLFPIVQAATLLALTGWLRRRGVARTVALSAAAVLALDLPLYAASLVGLADIPLSFFALLLGVSLSDAVDGTDPGAPLRLALASGLAAATKNEGLFLAAAALVVGVVAVPRGKPWRRRNLALAVVLPVFAVIVPHRLWRGPARLRDFDFGLLAPARWGELGSRIAETAGREAFHVLLPSLATVVALAALFALGRRTPWADRLLVIAGFAAAAYLILPALGVLAGRPGDGPLFLVRTAVARTLSALGPLVAAGIAGRFYVPGAGLPSAAVDPADP
ncbi:MAG TPA: glycosyltransferase family 39 protein [Thermoanaerobaculia bacterium]|nr:glycosyltransferase family 39 protein [Thermoanaerobaculia bacterium]